MIHQNETTDTGSGTHGPAEYKFIKFMPDDDEWVCCNRKTSDILGVVEWYQPWRKYIFAPTYRCVLDHSCLTDIADFMVALGAAQTKTLKTGVDLSSNNGNNI